MNETISLLHATLTKLVTTPQKTPLPVISVIGPSFPQRISLLSSLFDVVISEDASLPMSFHSGFNPFLGTPCLINLLTTSTYSCSTTPHIASKCRRCIYLKSLLLGFSSSTLVIFLFSSPFSSLLYEDLKSIAVLSRYTARLSTPFIQVITTTPQDPIGFNLGNVLDFAKTFNSIDESFLKVENNYNLFRFYQSTFLDCSDPFFDSDWSLLFNNHCESVVSNRRDHNTWLRTSSDVSKFENLFSSLFSTDSLRKFQSNSLELVTYFCSPHLNFLSFRLNSSLNLLRDFITTLIDSKDKNLDQIFTEAQLFGSKKLIDDGIIVKTFKDLVQKRVKCPAKSITSSPCSLFLHPLTPFSKVPRFPGDTVKSLVGVKGKNLIEHYHVIGSEIKRTEKSLEISDVFLWSEFPIFAKKLVYSFQNSDAKFQNTATCQSKIFALYSGIPSFLFKDLDFSQIRTTHSCENKPNFGCFCGRREFPTDPPFSWNFLLTQAHETIQYTNQKSPRFNRNSKRKDQKNQSKCSLCCAVATCRIWIQFHLVAPSIVSEPTPIPSIIGCLIALDSRIPDPFSSPPLPMFSYIAGNSVLSPLSDDLFSRLCITDVNLGGVEGGSMGVGLEYECHDSFSNDKVSKCSGCRFLLDHAILASFGLVVPPKPSDLAASLLGNDLPLILPCPRCSNSSAFLSRLHLITPNNRIKCLFRPVFGASIISGDAKVAPFVPILLPPSSAVTFRVPIAFTDLEGTMLKPSVHCKLLKKWVVLQVSE
ncbi:hypothetical protein RCL1_007836 [Eukaryota sp. TZLM3-RCL]